MNYQYTTSKGSSFLQLLVVYVAALLGLCLHGRKPQMYIFL